jgi:hypothetical protein
MSAMPAAQTMTAEEFLDLPDTDDLRSAELVEGELVVDPPRARDQLEVGDTLTSPQLDGFELSLAEPFPE